MKIIVICLSIFLFSCSSIYYANKFSKIEESNWIVDNNGSCTNYTYYFSNNLVKFNFCNRGKVILYGPAYLPIIPSFGNSFFDSTMKYQLLFQSKGSLIMSNKIKVIINSKDELILDIITDLKSSNFNTVESEYYFNLLQSITIERELDSINTLEIYIDSIRVKDKVFYIEPLKLKKGKKLLHEFIVN